MLEIDLVRLEDFIGLVKANEAGPIFLQTGITEGKLEPDKRVLMAQTRLSAYKEYLYAVNIPLVRKELDKPEDEAAFTAEVKAELGKLNGILRNTAQGIVVIEGAIWPIR